MTPEEFRQYLDDLARQHNGRAGEPRIIDPEVETVAVSAKGAKVVTGIEPNPTPTYEFRFRDNTYLRVKGSGGDPGTSQAGSYQIVGGTAGVKPGASQEAPILRDTLTGIKRWEEESKSLVDVPGGEKEPPDPIDAAWKKNLDRIEQQQRIAKAATPAPFEPTISTSARQIWGKLPDGTMGWVDNPNYREPAGPAGPQYRPLSEVLAQVRAEADERIRADTAVIAEKIRLGVLEPAAVAREADALIQRELKALENGYAKAIADYQSQLRIGEFEKTQKPFMEAQLGLQREAADLARGQAQASVLMKQGEAAQGILSRLVEGGVEPGAETVQWAFSPIQQAMAILQRGFKAGEIDQNMMPVAQPQPLPAQQQALTAPPPAAGQPQAPAPQPTAAPVAPAPAPPPWDDPNYRTPLGWPGR